MPPKPTPSWRSILKVHPACDRFPLMGDDELDPLGGDIRKHGLHESIVVMRRYRRCADGKFDLREHDLVLIDGKNRLTAMERAGFKLVRDGKLDPTLGHKAFGLEPPLAGAYAEFDGGEDEVVAFVISRNIHRRQLTPEKRGELMVEFIACAPDRSDRQIAKELGVDHKTIGRARAKGEDVGRIPHVETRTDTKGRAQPARKTGQRTKKPPAKPEPAPTIAAAAVEAVQPPSRDDVGPSSTGELERLGTRNEELENRVRRLEIENHALRSEVEKLKAELAKRPPPVDDGIPDFLRRAAS